MRRHRLVIHVKLRLRASGLTLRFVTNTTKESRRSLFLKLTSLGFELKEEEMFTSLSAARVIVERRRLRPMLLLEESALEDYHGIETNNPNAVVVGLAPSHFHYEMLNKAFRLLMDGAPLIAIHKGRYYKRSDGLALGPGAFVEGLEYATDTTAEVVGKPQPEFFLSSLCGLEADPSQTIMIGDDVRDDIGGAQGAGLIGFLVKTGKYREGDEHKITPPAQYVFEDFLAAVNYLLQQIRK